MVKRNRTKKQADNAKRWAQEIVLQDAASSPVVRRPATSLTTPAARAAASTTSSSKKMTTTPPAAQTPLEKRWIWANSVIQDDTPASEVPPVGENANLLSEREPCSTCHAELDAGSLTHVSHAAASTISTPQATLVASTFPIQASSSTENSTAVTSVVAAEAAIASAEAATTSTSAAPAAASTSPALPWWDPTEFFHDVEAGFEKLFGLSDDDEDAASASATAAPTVSTAEVEKRWVWATGIIQDDTPNAPPVGQNVNLLGSASVNANTPSVTLVAPSFRPKAPASGAFVAPSVRVIAAAPPVATVSSKTTPTPAAPLAPSSTPAWQSVQDEVAAASASRAAAALASIKRLSPLERAAIARAKHSNARMAKVKRGGHA